MSNIKIKVHDNHTLTVKLDEKNDVKILLPTNLIKNIPVTQVEKINEA